jgi:hypothetical protein
MPENKAQTFFTLPHFGSATEEQVEVNIDEEAAFNLHCRYS